MFNNFKEAFSEMFANKGEQVDKVKNYPFYKSILLLIGIPAIFVTLPIFIISTLISSLFGVLSEYWLKIVKWVTKELKSIMVSNALNKITKQKEWERKT